MRGSFLLTNFWIYKFQRISPRKSLSLKQFEFKLIFCFIYLRRESPHTNNAEQFFALLDIANFSVPTRYRGKKREKKSFIENIASHSIIVILLCEMKWQFYLMIIIAEYLFCGSENCSCEKLWRREKVGFDRRLKCSHSIENFSKLEKSLKRFGAFLSLWFPRVFAWQMLRY